MTKPKPSKRISPQLIFNLIIVGDYLYSWSNIGEVGSDLDFAELTRHHSSILIQYNTTTPSQMWTIAWQCASNACGLRTSGWLITMWLWSLRSHSSRAIRRRYIFHQFIMYLVNLKLLVHVLQTQQSPLRCQALNLLSTIMTSSALLLNSLQTMVLPSTSLTLNPSLPLFFIPLLQTSPGSLTL